MKLLLIKKYIWITIFFVLFFVFCLSQETKIKLEVTPWQITWWVESSWLNLGTVEIWETQKELTWQFDWYFWVSDLEASDLGWSTTVKCDWLNWSNGWILTWIYMMVDDLSPELLLWVPWNVLIDQNFLNYYSINTSVTYIYRPAWANFGRINKYWDKPHIKVIIPPYSAPWSYSWIIYFDM